MVLGAAIVSLLPHLCERVQVTSLRIVLPLAVLCVVAFDKFGDLVVELAIQVATEFVPFRVQLLHQVVNQLEVVRVVDLLLLDGGVEDLGPDIFIIPHDVIELPGQVEQCPLIVADFLVPEWQNHIGLELLVE